MNHFLDLAYDTPRWSAADSTNQWLKAWATREWGNEHANEIADIMSRYGMYAARRKYELLDPSIYSLINYNEADSVVHEWKVLANDAEKVYHKLPQTAQASFFEFVLQPCNAGYIVTDIYVTAGKNNLYAGQRRTSANTLAAQALDLFRQDHELTQRYHNLLDGKWNHMMDQTHLGYDYW